MTLIWYEIKKVLLKPSCCIALLILAVLATQSCVQAISGNIGSGVHWSYEDGQTEEGYAAAQKLRAAQSKWSGTLNQQLLEKALAELKQIDSISEDDEARDKIIYAQRQELKVIRDLLNQSFKSNYQWEYQDYFLAETLDSKQLPYFYENRITQLRDWLYNEGSTGYSRFSEAEKQYLIECYESLETPFQVDYSFGWDMSYEVSMSIALWGSILLAFLIAQIFAGEFRWKTDSIYFSTEHGRKRGSITKLLAGFLLTTIVYWVVMLIANLIVLSCLGVQGANCPIQANANWWNSIYNITFIQRTLLGLLDGYLCWLFVAAAVMLMSATSRSISLGVLVPCLLMLIPRFLEDSNIASSLSTILCLLPNKMLTTYGNEPIALYTVFGKVMPPITIQRCLYPALALILALVCYWAYQRKQVR